MNIPTKQETELKSLIPPQLQRQQWNQALFNTNQDVLSLINLIKSKDFQVTAKIYDLETFIYGLENLQRNTVQLLEYVKAMHLEKENDG